MTLHRRNVFALLFLGLLIPGGLSPIRAQVSVTNALYTIDQSIRNYGLISFGNASFTNYSSTGGPLAVAGNLHLDGGSIAQQGDRFGSSSDPTLYVGGNLTMSNWVHLQNGYAALPNLTGSFTWDATQKRLSGNGGILSTSNTRDPLGAVDPRNNPAPSNWDFATLQSTLAQASADLAAATANGLIKLNGQNLIFDANGQTSGVVVFNLDMNRFNGVYFDADGNGSWNRNQERVSNVSISVPSDVTYVINVLNATGRTILDGINFNAGTNNNQLLWNITPDANPSLADSVRLGGQSRFYGTVLAPLIDLSNSANVSPEGQVIAATYSQTNAALNFASFEPNVSFTPVPEPRAWALAGIAAALLSIGLQRRRRSSATRDVATA